MLNFKLNKGQLVLCIPCRRCGGKNFGSLLARSELYLDRRSNHFNRWVLRWAEAKAEK